MELKDIKLINNGGIPQQEQRLEDKISSTAIPLGGSTGKSTLADRKAIHNLPKFEKGKPGPVQITGLGGGTTNNFNFAGRTSAAAQLGKGLTPDASKAINSLPTGPSDGGGGGLGKAIDGIGDVAGSAVSSLGGAIDFVGGIASAGQFNMTADDALKDAGTSSGNIGGISYTRQNDVNAAQISAQTGAENTANTVGLMGKGASLGASIGSVAGPVGGLIGGAVGAIGGLVGGLFGGAARRRKMRRMIAEAKDKAFRQNDFSRSGALTSAMQQQYAQEFGDTESQSLYGFVNGKQSFSAAGPTEGYNARVSSGEIIANKFTGEMFRVPGLPNNKDGKLALIRPSDTIITNKYGLSDYVAETGDLEGGEAMMSSIMKTKGIKGYKCGKLPKFEWGLPEWANAVGNVLPMINAAVDKHNIENEPISSPNTRKTNPYANVALKTMADMRFNNYQAYNDLWDTAYKYRNAANNNGNLSAAQRAVMNYAGYKDAMDSMAKLNQYAQEANNKYGQVYAQMAAQLGDEQAKRDQQAAQFDYEAYNQAHGARRMMASQRAADMASYLQNWTKGLTDMHMWRDQMKLWQDQNDIARADLYHKMGLDENGNKIVSKKNITTPATSTVSGGRILNPSALTSAIQRGAAIGRQETPYWSPNQIMGMLDYIRQNNFFLNR